MAQSVTLELSYEVSNKIAAFRNRYGIASIEETIVEMIRHSWISDYNLSHSFVWVLWQETSDRSGTTDLAGVFSSEEKTNSAAKNVKDSQLRRKGCHRSGCYRSIKEMSGCHRGI